MKNNLDDKKEVLTKMYKQKGVNEEIANKLVDTMAEDKDTLLNYFMCEKYGFTENGESPIHHGVVTFISFVIFGAIPLFTYVFTIFFPGIKDNPLLLFLITCILTGISLFSLGTVKVKFTRRNKWISGLESLFIGGLAASIAYLIGNLLNNLV